MFQDDDCRADYTAFPAALPVDYSVCTGTCRLTFYWLAVHSPQWQIYSEFGYTLAWALLVLWR